LPVATGTAAWPPESPGTTALSHEILESVRDAGTQELQLAAEAAVRAHQIARLPPDSRDPTQITSDTRILRFVAEIFRARGERRESDSGFSAEMVDLIEKILAFKKVVRDLLDPRGGSNREGIVKAVHLGVSLVSAGVKDVEELTRVIAGIAPAQSDVRWSTELVGLPLELTLAKEWSRAEIRNDRSGAPIDIARLLTHVEEHLFEPGLTLASAKAQFEVTPERFRKQMGMGFGAYIAEKRMKSRQTDGAGNPNVHKRDQT